MRIARMVVLILLWGLAGAAAVFALGTVWINLSAAGVEGSEAMGRAILLAFYLVPGGFMLGALAGAVSLRHAATAGRRAVRPAARPPE